MLILLTHTVILLGALYALSHFLHLPYLMMGLSIQQTHRT